FSGRAAMVQHITYGKRTTINCYDRDWKPLDVFWVYPQGAVIDRPADYQHMLALAEQLGIFGFARIDLMVSAGRIYLSEITHYPTSGFQVIKPIEYDYALGEHWKL